MHRVFIVLILFSTLSCVYAQEGASIPQFANETNAISGFLTVPENRSDPNTRDIELAYVVLKANSSAPKKDPIIYLMGGPGGSATSTLPFWRNSQLRRDRDFVLIDQRGTGLSSAVCTDLSSGIFNVMSQDLSMEEEIQALRELANSCKAEMNSVGHDQEGYNTPENVNDLEALRVHLGYEKWNLFGSSYGTRLALAYMRAFPENVRTSTMVGLDPPQVNFYADFSSNFNRSLEMVFEACASDKSCARRYPNLKVDFFEVLEGLKSNPISTNYNGSLFVLNPQDLLLLTQQSLYGRATIEQLPRLIIAIKNGDTNGINGAIANVNAVLGIVNTAMHWSFEAYAEFGRENSKSAYIEDLERNSELFPGVSFVTSSNEILESWHKFRANPILSEPVQSDIPSLVVNGDFDPITPPAYAKETMKYLSNAFYAVFAMDGHNTFNPCFFGMMTEFLENPDKQPNLSCAAKSQNFNWR